MKDLIVEIVKPRELTAEDSDVWKRILQAQPRLWLPQLMPEFAWAAQAAGRCVEIAVLKDSQGIVGFFAFARTAAQVAEPVGGVTSDQEAWVIPADRAIDMRFILKACGLRRWEFGHWDAIQCRRLASMAYLDDCRVIDLSQGLENYEQHIRSNHSSWWNGTHRKGRKLAREVGAVEFQWQDPEVDECLGMLARWKRQQLLGKGFSDMFQEEWVTRLFHESVRHSSDDFQVIISTLRSGGELLAVHLGLRSGETLLSWIPTFHPDFAKYSPGNQLMWSMVQRAPQVGIVKIDLGRGENPSKDCLANAAVPVGVGVVTSSAWSTLMGNTVVDFKRRALEVVWLRRFKTLWQQRQQSR